MEERVAIGIFEGNCRARVPAFQLCNGVPESDIRLCHECSRGSKSAINILGARQTFGAAAQRDATKKRLDPRNILCSPALTSCEDYPADLTPGAGQIKAVPPRQRPWRAPPTSRAKCLACRLRRRRRDKLRIWSRCA
jgi:hypothetical protein